MIKFYMSRCELSDSRRGRYPIGERPLKLPFSIGYSHHFEEMPDPDNLTISDGCYQVNFTINYEAGGTQNVRLKYSTDVEGHKQYIQNGLRAMEWHNQEHKKKSDDGIRASNEGVLPIAKSLEISHRENKSSA